jgi:hypothetical protein
MERAGFDPNSAFAPLFVVMALGAVSSQRKMRIFGSRVRYLAPLRFVAASSGRSCDPVADPKRHAQLSLEMARLGWRKRKPDRAAGLHGRRLDWATIRPDTNPSRSQVPGKATGADLFKRLNLLTRVLSRLGPFAARR